MTEYTLLCERKAAFETNSSSSHSLVIDENSPLMSPEEIKRLANSDGIIYICDDEYGWEIEEYRGPSKKMSYLYTYAHDCVDSSYSEELEEQLKRVIEEFTGLTIVFNPMHGYYGYIDHQSVDVPAKVFKQGDQAIVDFIFRSGSFFLTDNDNH